MAEELISERAQLLLQALVRRYIRDGQPVGSKALLEEAKLPVSSATARNVMADLEERGLLTSPHTSAGRIPTQQGYRYFVDKLVAVESIAEQDLGKLKLGLDPNKSPKELAETASRLLSSVTAQAGLVTMPRLQLAVLRQVEFLPLSGSRVLVVMIANEQEVQNQIIHTAKPFTEADLKKAAHWINQRFAGKPLQNIRDELFAQMRSDKQAIDGSLQGILDLAGKTFEQSSETTDYVVAGESQLVNAVEPGGVDKLRDLLAAFEYKKDILDLVDRCIHADGVQIFIGAESGYDVLEGYSLITAPYDAGDQRLGVLGVIGPTRMAYDRVISMVDVTAKMLGVVLNKSGN